MSASERLRELDFGTTADDGEIGMMGHEDMLVLRDARDAIADVVEAAENAVMVAWMDKATDEQNLELKHRADAINSSLTALREALEEK